MTFYPTLSRYEVTLIDEKEDKVTHCGDDCLVSIYNDVIYIQSLTEGKGWTSPLHQTKWWMKKDKTREGPFTHYILEVTLLKEAYEE